MNYTDYLFLPLSVLAMGIIALPSMKLTGLLRLTVSPVGMLS